MTQTQTLTIPGYSIIRKLGEGGMATVYLAVQHNLEREVALKVMSPLLNSDPSFAARFKREARIIAQLSHASIVPVFEVGAHQSNHYLAMEYLSGGDLKRRILDGQCDASLAVKMCASLCAALDVAHRKGFVHRDIKPENILFRGDGTPVLTDFGIARALDNGRSMTVAGMLVGTPDYMSPEQVKGLELDGRSDLYSLGVVFYEMLKGTVPFKADSTLSVALKQVSDSLPPLPPQYAAYQEFLDCLTAKDREERFASGAEVIRALQLVGTRRPAPTPPPARVADDPQPTLVRRRPAPRPRLASEEAPTQLLKNATPRKRVWLIAAMVAAVAVAATLIVASLPSAPPPVAQTDKPAPAPTKVVAADINPTPAPPEPPPSLPPPPPAEVVPTPPPPEKVQARAEAVPSAPDTQVHTTASRRKRLAEQRSERKAEEARLIEQHAAELRAAQLQEQDARVHELLARAKTEYAAGALWEPAGANAADDYREILEMQPQRAEAAAGAQRVANLLAAEAAQTEAIGDIYTTKLLIDRIQALQPDHPKLADLQQKLEQLLTSPTTLGARQRSHLEQAATYIAKANTDLGRDPVDFRALDAATTQYDKAVSTAATAPGLPSLQERLVAAYAVAIRTELGQDPNRARKLLNVTHRHHWSSPELEQLEASLAAGSAPTTPVQEAQAQ
jgi:serine/threonine-protein kinase PpkA